MSMELKTGWPGQSGYNSESAMRSRQPNRMKLMKHSAQNACGELAVR